MSLLSLFDDTENPLGSELCTVSELTALIKLTLEEGFSDVALRAEVSNLSRPKSGHVYFALKDEGASIRAVLWKRDAQRVVFKLEDGLAVRVWGRVTVYAPRGDYQLVVRKIEPEGIGALELAFRQTVARLAAEGLFDPARKRPLPRFPRRIIVVTSPTGAAVRDFLHVVARRWRGVEILVAPAKVQGLGAAAELAAGIALANRVAGADLVVLARGGGSLEDLWAFNEEVVARAIVASRLPVVSAVGHEVDVTIADLAADLRAPTPSAAGELCVPEMEAVRTELEHLSERLTRAGQAHLDRARAQLNLLAERARRALRRDLDGRRHGLARLAAALEALSPLGVLARGYSVTFKADGATLVRSAGDARPGDLIQTRLASGRILSRVEGTER
jgi:exodeoxyribonuclease VII large subunit